MEFVKFRDVLKRLGVELEEVKSPVEKANPPDAPAVTKLREIEQQISQLNLPENNKESILATINCTIDAITINPKINKVSASGLAQMVKNKFPVKPVCFDANYYLTNLETLSKLIGATLSNKMQYVVDRFDCDNFAEYVSSTMALEYGLNSVGQCFVALIAYSGFEIKPIGLHACNMVVATDGVKLYEPQLNRFLDGMVLRLEKGGEEINVVYLPSVAVFC